MMGHGWLLFVHQLVVSVSYESVFPLEHTVCTFLVFSPLSVSAPSLQENFLTFSQLTKHKRQSTNRPQSSFYLRIYLCIYHKKILRIIKRVAAPQCNRLSVTSSYNENKCSGCVYEYPARRLVQTPKLDISLRLYVQKVKSRGETILFSLKTSVFKGQTHQLRCPSVPFDSRQTECPTYVARSRARACPLT